MSILCFSDINLIIQKQAHYGVFCNRTINVPRWDASGESLLCLSRDHRTLWNHLQLAT